jgi:hypothetical protein
VTQLLEVENDLIAGYFAEADRSPMFEFGQESDANPIAE